MHMAPLVPFLESVIKSNLLSLYNVTCMYVFSGECLVSGDQWGRLSLPLSVLLPYLLELLVEG